MGKLRDYVPALKYGNKIYPDDIAGLIGLPYVGNIVYVDPSGGSDDAGGSSVEDALATVGAAEAKTTGSQHDAVIIVPTGGTGRTTEDTAIAWDKRFTHLIGNSVSLIQDNRAGLNFATGGSLTMSENGSIFKNLTMFSSADIDLTVQLTGSYNQFSSVDFKGTSNATSADSTPWRALYVNGGQENAFYGCTFGADTYTRGVANATLEFANSASRNYFGDCRFIMHADSAETQLHVLLTGASAIDRWLEFEDCKFYAFYTNHAAKVNAVFDNSEQTATGDILMTGVSYSVGFDDWEASASNIMWFNTFDDETAKIGIALNQS